MSEVRTLAEVERDAWSDYDFVHKQLGKARDDQAHAHNAIICSKYELDCAKNDFDLARIFYDQSTVQLEDLHRDHDKAYEAWSAARRAM